MSDHRSNLPPMQQQTDPDVNANEGADPSGDVSGQNEGGAPFGADENEDTLPGTLGDLSDMDDDVVRAEHR